VPLRCLGKLLLPVPTLLDQMAVSLGVRSVSRAWVDCWSADRLRARFIRLILPTLADCHRSALLVRMHAF